MIRSRPGIGSQSILIIKSYICIRRQRHGPARHWLQRGHAMLSQSSDLLLFGPIKRNSFTCLAVITFGKKARSEEFINVYSEMSMSFGKSTSPHILSLHHDSYSSMEGFVSDCAYSKFHHICTEYQAHKRICCKTHSAMLASLRTPHISHTTGN